MLDAPDVDVPDVEPVAVGVFGAWAVVLVPPGSGLPVARRGVVVARSHVVAVAGRVLRTCSMAGCVADNASGARRVGAASPAPITAAARDKVHSRRLARSARCLPKEMEGADWTVLTCGA